MAQRGTAMAGIDFNILMLSRSRAAGGCAAVIIASIIIARGFTSNRHLVKRPATGHHASSTHGAIVLWRGVEAAI